MSNESPNPKAQRARRGAFSLSTRGNAICSSKIRALPFPLGTPCRRRRRVSLWHRFRRILGDPTYGEILWGVAPGGRVAHSLAESIADPQFVTMLDWFNIGSMITVGILSTQTARFGTRRTGWRICSLIAFEANAAAWRSDVQCTDDSNSVWSDVYSCGMSRLL